MESYALKGLSEGGNMTRQQDVVGVVGLGYVGLPTALGLLEAGFSVLGVDINKRLVDDLNDGRGGRGHIPGDLPATGEKWKVSTDFAILKRANIILITVPTPIGKDLKPNLGPVESASSAVMNCIADGGSPHVTVVLESTVYPGVTRSIIGEAAQKAGLLVGTDVHLAYCPERLVPGDDRYGVRQVPRVVGADNPEVGQMLVEMYSRLTTGEVTYVGRPEVAEGAKVVENVQRDLNIALVNELSLILPAVGVDVEDVLDAAATKWNFHRYTPGVGVGGHCIPVDPYYLMRRAEELGIGAELIGAARSVNRSMPLKVAEEVERILSENNVEVSNASIIVLGWSYKPDVPDGRETPVEPLVRGLIEKGMSVTIHDPFTNDLFDHIAEDLHSLLTAEYSDVPASDMVILATSHSMYDDEFFEVLRAKVRLPLFYDGRRSANLSSLAAKGWDVHAIGRP